MPTTSPTRCCLPAHTHTHTHTHREWSEQRRKEDPSYFQRLSNQQTPEYLWIGCSDSRVPVSHQLIIIIIIINSSSLSSVV